MFYNVRHVFTMAWWRRALAYGMRSACLHRGYANLAVGADTIFALSSGSGKAGVAIIRVSGRQAASAADKLINGEPHVLYGPLTPMQAPLPSPRVSGTRVLTDPRDGSMLDHAMVLCFEGPKSFTGEVLS